LPDSANSLLLSLCKKYGAAAVDDACAAALEMGCTNTALSVAISSGSRNCR